MNAEPDLRGSLLIRRPTRLLVATLCSGSASRIFLLFFLAFLPLGIIALLGVLQAFRTAEHERVARLQLSVEQRVNRLTRVMAEDRRTLLFLVDSLEQGGPGYCRRAEAILTDRKEGPLLFVVFDRAGRVVCASNGADREGAAPGGAMLAASDVAIDGAAQRLLLRTMEGDGSLVAVGAYSQEAVSQIVGAGEAGAARRILLHAGNERLIVQGAAAEPDPHTVIAAGAPISRALALTESIRRPPTTLAALLVLLLPIILWLIAAGIAWYSVHRLLVQPLAAMQRAVATYRPGDDPEPIRRRSAFFEEINVLGETFYAMAQDVSSHERQMTESLDRQRRLTREVHHRVKNNLQIITSLVSLHSRLAASPEAAVAYASIQRRVDALAVVHRNHFAEIEQNEGISGSALLNDLASSLRGGGVDLGKGFSLRVECDSVILDQDVAMPVAFIITELVELAARVNRNATVNLSLRRAEPGTAGHPQARLSVQSEALCDTPQLRATMQQGFERVLRGLSRQLRSDLLWDEQQGRQSILVATLR